MLKILFITVALCYPLGVYWGLQYFDARTLLFLLVAVLALRWQFGSRLTGRATILVSFIGICLVAIIGGEELGLKFYPAMINFSLLLLFAGSLVFTPTIIERIARRKQPQLSEHGVIYTRRVTYVWCVFFLLNGSIASATALWASESVWLLYNGFIAYILIALLFCCEWLIRQRVMDQSDV